MKNIDPSTQAAPHPDRHYLEILKVISTEVLTESTIDQRLSKLVTIVSKKLFWDACSIYIFDQQENNLALAATCGLSPESVGTLRIPLSEGVVGSVVSEERAFFIENTQVESLFKHFPETGEDKFLSLAAVPFYQEGRVSGVLTVQTISTYRFSTTDKHFLEILASQIGHVVDIALSLKLVAGRSELLLFGKSAAPGIGKARVHIIDSSANRVEVLARGFRGEDLEIGLFDSALKLALQEIDAIVAQIENPTEATILILTSQKVMLQDPEFKQKVYQTIKSSKKSAPRVVALLLDEYIKKFSSFDSRILREKAHDIKDIKNTLLRLMGEKVRQLVPEFEEEQMVIAAYNLTPLETARLDTSKVVAIVTEQGNKLSHAAIMAKALQLPAVIGAKELMDTIEPGDTLLVDGNNGYIYINPNEEIESQYQNRSIEITSRIGKLRESLTDSAEKSLMDSQTIKVQANIGLPFEIELARKEGILSVGLLRTEFFYMRQQSWPDETTQVDFYKHIFKSFHQGTITVRILDIGGDKTLPYFSYLNQDNSQFGSRSVRLLLDHPEILKSQIHAIHLAALETKCKPRILIPMVTHAWEITAIKEIMAEVIIESDYSVGAMIETPGSIFQVEELAAEADFITVGTNDLTQFLLAVDRNNDSVAHLYHPLHPSIMRALDLLFTSSIKHSIPFSVCGEMAGDYLSALALFALQCQNISISPSQALQINYLFQKIPEDVLVSLRRPLLTTSDSKESVQLLRKIVKKYAPLLL